jgi:transposase
MSKYDVNLIKKLYIEENRTIASIAKEFSTTESSIANFINYYKLRKGGMASHKKTFDKGTLERLYIEEDKGKYEIAKILNVNYGVINRLLKEYGIERDEKYDIEQIKKWYIDDVMTSKEICKLIGTSSGTVIRILRKAGVEIRPTGNINGKCYEYKPNQKKYGKPSPFKQTIEGDKLKLLKELYTNNTPIKRIKEQLGVGVRAIKRAVNEHGFNRTKSMKARDQYDDSRDKEIIFLYQNGESPENIGQWLNISRCCVMSHLKHNHIKLRTMSESQFNYRNKHIPPELMDYERMYDMYVTQRMSKKDIGVALNVGADVINRVLKEFGIHIRDCSESKIGLYTGGNHPNWKGGRTDLYMRLREYFYVNQAKSVVKRDGRKCQLCGSTHKLQVHHIRPFKDIFNEILSEHPNLDVREDCNELYEIIRNDDRMNDLNNLITYCKECHLFKVHGYIKGSTKRNK